MPEVPARSWRAWPGQLGQRSWLLAVVPMLLALSTIGVLLYVPTLTRQADDEVQRGLRALGQIHAVHAALAEAASGVRGFLITRDETFLQPFHRAGPKLSAALQQLDEDIEDPIQRSHLAEINRLVTIKLATLDVLASQAGDLSGGQVTVYSRENKALLDRFRQSIEAMEAREQQIILDLQQRRQQTWQRGVLASVVVVLMAFVVATVLSQGFALGLVRRIRHLRDNALRIGRREALASCPTSSRDELAELDELLVDTGRTLYQKLDELEAARHMAEEASLAKTRFLSRTSHELRTPLHAVLGFSRLLAGQADSPAQQRQFDAIEYSARHLLHLVDDLLDMARIEAGQVSVQSEELALGPVVRRAFDMVQARASPRGISLVQALPDELPLVTADAARVLQVLINLLDNAIKFSPAGRRVRVEAEATPDSRVRVHIIDEGPGVPEAFRGEIFKPFARVSAQGDGMGLGLAISHALMEAMGGELSFTPHESGGSCFTMTLCGVERTHGVGQAAAGQLPVPEIPATAIEPAPAHLVVLHSADEALCVRLEATAQRLGLASLRWTNARLDLAAEVPRAWILVHDARSSAVPPLPEGRLPVGVIVCGERIPPGLPHGLNVHVVAPQASAGAWRQAMEEMLDEQSLRSDP